MINIDSIKCQNTLSEMRMMLFEQENTSTKDESNLKFSSNFSKTVFCNDCGAIA